MIQPSPAAAPLATERRILANGPMTDLGDEGADVASAGTGVTGSETNTAWTEIGGVTTPSSTAAGKSILQVMDAGAAGVYSIGQVSIEPMQPR